MPRNIAKYYLNHFHMTAGPHDLLRRSIDKALFDLGQGDVESFVAKLVKIRRSLRFDGKNRRLAGAIARLLHAASVLARADQHEDAKSALAPLLEACTQEPTSDAPRVQAAMW